MPFDSTTFETDALGRLGIIPIAPEIAAKHRREVLRAYCERYRDHESVLTGAVRWKVHAVMSGTLRSTLLNPRRAFAHYSTDRSRAPSELVKLADYVERNIEHARFEIEYFYNDPILNVYYQDTVACLGIWDQGRLVHIAKHPLGKTPRWYRYVECLIPNRWR